jgi:hypothetical protein
MSYVTTPSMPTRLPYDLHANDIVRHIINIDSRHRDTPASSTSADFYYTLLNTIRNVIRIRVTSIEFPNNYFFYTRRRRNTHFYVEYKGCDDDVVRVPIEIPDGNYTVEQMIAELTDRMIAKKLPFLPLSGPVVDFSLVNGAFTFYGTIPFTIDTATGTRDRMFDYGLGYYLGFTRGRFTASPDVSGGFFAMSNICANFVGDSYLFLRVNDFNCVRQTVRLYPTAEGVMPTCAEFSALAKIVVREPKNYMSYDDYASHHIKEYVFPSPVSLSRLHVEVLDPYGDVIDLCSSQISFSLEITEVRNSSLCNAIRDSMAVQYL